MTTHSQIVPLEATTEEDTLWREFAVPLVGDLSQNVRDICHYGFSEMVNNAIDHSGSSEIGMGFSDDEGLIQLMVWDKGVGIFQKIQQAFGLDSEHDAALELAKGGVTTDPTRHTGQGIFFTARMFDKFALLSGDIAFLFEHGTDDWLIEDRKGVGSGTMVSMKIDPNSDRTTREVFDRFATGEGTFEFDTTKLGVRLLGLETGPLVSRSQARRLLSRLDQFKTVILDFAGVEEVGPAFADEIFRVFLNAHPGVRIVPVNSNERVSQMILQALAKNGLKDLEGSGP